METVIRTGNSVMLALVAIFGNVTTWLNAKSELFTLLLNMGEDEDESVTRMQVVKLHLYIIVFFALLTLASSIDRM